MSRQDSKWTRRREADLALVEDCLAGQQAAWETLVRRHEPTVHLAIRQALKIHTGSGEEAEVVELVAELFFRLVSNDFRRLRRYAGRSSLKTWLKVVAGNFVIDELRRSRPDLSLDDPDWAGLRAQLATSTAAPDARLERDEARALLNRLASQLPPDDRRFVELYYARELSFEAVAKAMSTTVGAIYSRKNRVRKKLAELLRAHRRKRGRRA
jgi:RNA polymerase sigma-70 factor (ECF subfamily)